MSEGVQCARQSYSMHVERDRLAIGHISLVKRDKSRQLQRYH